MVWPFGPSASFKTIVDAKRAQREQAINSQAAAFQADGPLTAEEVAIIGKSGGQLTHSRPTCQTNTSNFLRFRYCEINTGPRTYFDSGSQSLRQVRHNRS